MKFYSSILGFLQKENSSMWENTNLPKPVVVLLSSHSPLNFRLPFQPLVCCEVFSFLFCSYFYINNYVRANTLANIKHIEKVYLIFMAINDSCYLISTTSSNSLSLLWWNCLSKLLLHIWALGSTHSISLQQSNLSKELGWRQQTICEGLQAPQSKLCTTCLSSFKQMVRFHIWRHKTENLDRKYECPKCPTLALWKRKGLMQMVDFSNQKLWLLIWNRK